MPFTPFNCYSFVVSLTSPRHNAPPLCADLGLLYAQTSSRLNRDLSSLCLCAHRETHFSFFITTQVRRAITWPFSTPQTNKWAFRAAINISTQCWGALDWGCYETTFRHFTRSYGLHEFAFWFWSHLGCCVTENPHAGQTPRSAVPPDGGSLDPICCVFGVRRRRGMVCSH